jgi:hypothetical protein
MRRHRGGDATVRKASPGKPVEMERYDWGYRDRSVVVGMPQGSSSAGGCKDGTP